MPGTASTGRTRVPARSSGSILRRIADSRSSTWSGNPNSTRYLEAGDYAASIIVASNRDAGRTLALQLVPFAAEQKLLMSRDVTELEAVSRMRRDFIANVSHELKTPLTVINGFIETLQDVEVDDRQRARFLQLMQTQASNMQRLVADLLTLSALENEQNAVHEERFAIAPLLLALSSDAKSLSGDEHRIGLDIREAAIVHGSRDELASAFGNLVSNAVRYTPPGGTITLAWRVDPDGSGVFAVTDTGIGIAAEYLPRLTERFYRVDRSRSRATGGTGLGLAIVKHVLLRHQAEIEITSERGKGSTFAVRLPAQRVERARSTRRCGDRDASTRRRNYQYRSAARNRLLISSRPTSIGAFLITRYCGSAPVASASTCASSKPSAVSPFGMPVARISSMMRPASTSPASACVAPLVEPPSARAHRRWRSGCANAVWRHTDGLFSTTAMPCGTSVLPSG